METAVEWLEEFMNNGSQKSEGIISLAFAKAKLREKEQIRDAFNAGDLDSDTYFIPFLKENDESENYYNKTFKSE